MKRFIAPALWVIVFQLVGFSIGMATQADTMGWYQTLNKSDLNPPNFIFPLMWTTLYVLIALAGHGLWQHRSELPNPWKLFVLYAALNWGWSFVFFSFHMIGAALGWIIAVDLVSLLIVITVWQGNRPSAVMMIPPTLWTMFATYLSWQIWALN